MAEMVARYESRLTRYALHLAGDLDLARDAVQETFLALWRTDHGRTADHVDAWLYTVCRNQTLDLLRKGAPMDPLDSPAARAQASPEASPSAAAEAIECEQRLLEAVAALPPNQQEVVRLKLHAELSYREISQITGLTESNVGYLIHMGIRTIRERLLALDAPASTGA
jgi:RNA polymerase sigma-70 factor (ECF subfamily)